MCFCSSLCTTYTKGNDNVRLNVESRWVKKGTYSKIEESMHLSPLRVWFFHALKINMRFTLISAKINLAGIKMKEKK